MNPTDKNVYSFGLEEERMSLHWNAHLWHVPQSTLLLCDLSVPSLADSWLVKFVLKPVPVSTTL